MPLSNLLAVVSAGWALVLAGALLASAGIAVGINQAVPTVPLWLCLLAMGAAVSGAGWFLVSRGGEKASEKVDSEFPLTAQIVKHPLISAILATVLALIVARLFRIGSGSTPVAAAASVPPAGPVPPEQKVPPVQNQEAPEPPKERDFGSFISDQAKALGTLASEAALTIGLQSLGIPTVEELFNEFTKATTTKPQEDPNMPANGYSGEAKASRHNGYHKEPVRMG